MLPRIVFLFCFAVMLCVPCFAQPPAQAQWPAVSAPAATPAAADAAAASKVSASFKKTLEAAAVKAWKEGEITRWELAKVRMAIAFRPDALVEIQASVTDDAVAAGKMKPADAKAAAFDWSSLLEFIKQLLPLILQIISIFK